MSARPRRGALDDEWDLPEDDLRPPATAPSTSPDVTVLQFRYRLADALPRTAGPGRRTRATVATFTPPVHGSRRP